ncbi:MAG: TlyA family RNA methyltransferase [Lentisphaerae bacterium]|jgi:23S rRNA (cytidine1920-2'-O)/16S rRNA (cytidine1409-2'-O)-methyltransferase|nr:TlyA family RNA methyltransferase [Lentisphaerota bacterium]
MKQRLDNLVVSLGLADSREQARRLILAGEVRVNGHPATKAGHLFADDSLIEVAARPRFVSRGGDKLEGAFIAFNPDVNGLDCIDIGASTGGFTDCLLQHGAARVIAIDVGRAQLHERLRQDPRVTVMERFNARHLTANDLPFVPQFGVVDVSFISLRLILPPLTTVMAPGSYLVTLIKPQFEAGRGQAPGGVVRDPLVHQEVISAIKEFGSATVGLTWLNLVESPLRGPEGNIEFLACWQTPKEN